MIDHHHQVAVAQSWGSFARTHLLWRREASALGSPNAAATPEHQTDSEQLRWTRHFLPGTGPGPASHEHRLLGGGDRLPAYPVTPGGIHRRISIAVAISGAFASSATGSIC